MSDDEDPGFSLPPVVSLIVLLAAVGTWVYLARRRKAKAAAEAPVPFAEPPVSTPSY